MARHPKPRHRWTAVAADPSGRVWVCDCGTRQRDLIKQGRFRTMHVIDYVDRNGVVTAKAPPCHDRGALRVRRPQPGRPRQVCVSMHPDDLARLDAAVEELKRGGHAKATRSGVLRAAIAQFDSGRVQMHEAMTGPGGGCGSMRPAEPENGGPMSNERSEQLGAACRISAAMEQLVDKQLQHLNLPELRILRLRFDLDPAQCARIDAFIAAREAEVLALRRPAPVAPAPDSKPASAQTRAHEQPDDACIDSLTIEQLRSMCRGYRDALSEIVMLSRDGKGWTCDAGCDVIASKALLDSVAAYQQSATPPR